MEWNGYKPGFIYVLRSGPYYKIGYADNVEQRLKTVGAAAAPKLPEPIELLFSFQTTSKLIAERLLHDFFAKLRVKGEWFELLPRHVDMLRAFTGEYTVDRFVLDYHKVPTDLLLFTDEDIAFCQRFQLRIGSILPDKLADAVCRERISRNRKDRAERYKRSLTRLLDAMSVDDMEWIMEAIMTRGIQAEPVVTGESIDENTEPSD